MKRIALSLTLLVASMWSLNAKPVDFSMIQTVAGKFAESRFALERQEAVLELVYTGSEGAFYVFNIGSRGFVIIAADDAYRPVIGYSDESSFDPDNIPPALVDYLDGIALSINRLRSSGNAKATPMVAAEWESLLKSGELISYHGGRGVDFLCKTKWDQSYPYNYCCPEDPNGSGGHAIVGCLATAMSQLMRFWSMPAQGIGSHCYFHEDYGEICADFGNTVYDWDNMPYVLDNSASEAEKLATGTLCFHCGVTIDMGYGPDGSGGGSAPIPGAMHNYFDYTDQIKFLKRNDYELETWKSMVREQFDMGWPMYYGGCDNGCHAFVCDGYDDHDMFHFNLGWGGGSDGWYIIDEAPYTNPADAMFNFVPSEIFNLTPSAPTAFTVTPVSDSELRTTLSWINPSFTLNETPLTSLEEVLVLRDNEVIYTLANPIPGALMEFEDTNVPRYDVFHYTVYARANGRYGKQAGTQVSVGPSCEWKIVMSTSDIQGWNGGYVTVYNNAGHEVARCTLTSNTPSMAQLLLPLGNLSFGWTAPADTVDNMVLSIKDSNGNTVFSFTGSSDGLTSGVFFETNNGCGSEAVCDAPGNLVATADGGHITLTWDALETVDYGYNVYRDGLVCRLVPSGNSFVDEKATLGGHCYRLTALCEGGEGAFSNVTCASDGPCYPPRNLDYELTSSYKINLKWDPPAVAEGLSGYMIFRRTSDGEYQRIKLVGPNKVNFTDNTYLEEGDYYYQIYAYYGYLDCTSSPANRKYEPNVFELHAYYSPTELDEEKSLLTIAPNPTEGTVTIAGAEIQEVRIYNLVGQLVVTKSVEGETVTLDLGDLPEGLYFVHAIDRKGSCCVKKLVKQ